MIDTLFLAKYEIDPVETYNKQWYTVAAFTLATKKKVCDIFTKNVTYGIDELYLFVCSSSIKDKPIDQHISSKLFSKRLSLVEYSEAEVMEYVNSKIAEARLKPSVEEAFSYLEQYFHNDSE